MKTADLIAEAISLPVEERARVVDSLLKSLNPPEADMDKEWALVVKRRLVDLRTGVMIAMLHLASLPGHASAAPPSAPDSFEASSMFNSYFSIDWDAGPTYYMGDFSSPSTAWGWAGNGFSIVDVDSDGWLDVLEGGMRFLPDIRYAIRTPLHWLVNNGNGSFRDGAAALFSGSLPPEIYHASEIATADFNRDGRPDFLVGGGGPDSNPWPGELSQLYLSNSRGYADRSNTLPGLGGFAHFVATAAINGDGVEHGLILNICCGPERRPYFLMNDGSGHFSQDFSRLPPEVLAAATTGGYYLSATFGDINGDGFPDLVLGQIGERSENLARVYLNDGHGSFAHSPSRLLPRACYDAGTPNTIQAELQLLDVDGDGDLDILVSGTRVLPFYSGRCVQLLINDGNGNFTDESSIRLGDAWFDDGAQWVNAIIPVDINRDGAIDLVFVSDGSDPSKSTSETRILLGDGTGYFQSLPKDFFPHLTAIGSRAHHVFPLPLRSNGEIGFLMGWRAYDYTKMYTKYAVMTPTARLPSPLLPVSHSGGTLDASSLEVEIRIAHTHRGKAGQIFVAAQVDGQLFFKDVSGWRAWNGGPLQPWFSGTLSASVAIPVFEHLDTRGISGARILIGYGYDATEMLTTGRYTVAHTLP